MLEKQKIVYSEVGKFPSVQRDLAVLANKALPFGDIEKAIKKLNISKLQEIRLFDIFESDKLGTGKKSLAINFTFADEEKTLTDKEIDEMMQKIIQTFEKDLLTEVRK